MIPRTEWFKFALNCLRVGTKYKCMLSSYDDDWKLFAQDFRTNASEALEVNELYQAWLVTKRLKA